jgi:predicted HAD superfamily Cof-like phosphohydrolase
MSNFNERIAAFNAKYKLGVFSEPELPGRLNNFLKILKDEVSEGDELLEKVRAGRLSYLDALVELADWLGDLQVFCASEMLRHDLPIAATLDIIMDSNDSKLGADGEPIYDETGKVQKGPNYWKPEPKLAQMLIGYFQLKAQEGGKQTD